MEPKYCDFTVRGIAVWVKRFKGCCTRRDNVDVMISFDFFGINCNYLQTNLSSNQSIYVWISLFFGLEICLTHSVAMLHSLATKKFLRHQVTADTKMMTQKLKATARINIKSNCIQKEVFNDFSFELIQNANQIIIEA